MNIAALAALAAGAYYLLARPKKASAAPAPEAPTGTPTQYSDTYTWGDRVYHVAWGPEGEDGRSLASVNNGRRQNLFSFIQSPDSSKMLVATSGDPALGEEITMGLKDWGLG